MIPCRGCGAILSPAVNTIWSSVPVVSNKASRSLSKVGLERSHSYPVTLLVGYDLFNASTAEYTLLLLEEDIVTDAPDSIDASATANPIPVSCQLTYLSSLVHTRSSSDNQDVFPCKPTTILVANSSRFSEQAPETGSQELWPKRIKEEFCTNLLYFWEGILKDNSNNSS